MAGGGGETTSTVHQSSLPEYAKPYYENLMERGIKESQRPYQTYDGQRIAGMSGQTQTGLNMASNYASSGLGTTNQAQSLANQTGQQALALGNYSPTNFTADQVGADQVSAERVAADQIGFQDFNSDMASRYMSPYMEDVIERARQDVVKNTMEEQAMRNAQAATTGAFGGSRAAVQNQMAIGQAQDRMMDLTVEGRQAAFENAQQQFERDRNAYFNSSQSNQQANLQASLANQGKSLEAMTANQRANLEAQLANQGKNLEAQQLGEQSRQFGANLGLQGLEAAQRSAGLMGELSAQQDQMVLDRIKAQLGVGQTTEDYKQEQLDQAYADFVNQRDASRQNLQFLSSLLQGVPVSANQDVQTTTPTNPLAGGIGTLAGLQSLYQLGRS